MPKRYKNSPITEAACGFTFEPSGTWDATIPGVLYERLRNDGFTKKKPVKNIQTVLTTGQNELQQPVVQQQLLQREHTQLMTEEGKSIVQVGPFFLSVNRLAPYLGWELFSPTIKKALNEYRAVAEPGGLLGVHLQYVNQIVVPHLPIELEYWFNFRYILPVSLENPNTPTTGFIVGVQFPFENARDLLKLQFASGISSNPNEAVLILQIGYEVVLPNTLSLDQVDSWLGKAHQQIEDAFEGCITDQSRLLFGIEEESDVHIG